MGQPQRYNPNLYEMTINYEPHIHYGYEVNYLIYNYIDLFSKYLQTKTEWLCSYKIILLYLLLFRMNMEKLKKRWGNRFQL